MQVKEQGVCERHNWGVSSGERAMGYGVPTYCSFCFFFCAWGDAQAAVLAARKMRHTGLEALKSVRQKLSKAVSHSQNLQHRLRGIMKQLRKEKKLASKSLCVLPSHFLPPCPLMSGVGAVHERVMRLCCHYCRQEGGGLSEEKVGRGREEAPARRACGGAAPKVCCQSQGLCKRTFVFC